MESKKAIRLWSATDVELISTDRVKSHPFIKNLGPDVLCDFVDYLVLSDRLQSKDCRNRMAAHLMLEHLGELEAAKALETAKMSVILEMESMQAAKMGFGTDEIGDKVVAAL